MNLKTEQLLATLEVITEGLWYSTESDAPIKPFVWEFAKKGNFNLINFLTDKNRLQMVNLSNYSKAYQRATKTLKHQQPIALIEELQSHLTDLEFYSVDKDSLFFQMIVGKTTDDAWVGLTVARSKYCSFGNPLSVKDGYTSQQAEVLLTKIDPFLQKMKLLLKPELHKDTKIIWEVAASKTEVLIKLVNACQLVETYQYFSLQNQELDNFLTNQLQQLRSYVINWNIYAIGQITNEDWLGISTSGYWS
ncbi:nuclease A inhibitor family protein [Aerosakkonemataceae cyanobacterium BLCC-F50]|uniref:Nuclease A inhibitor family protein n=1 Tax=Floridaenema flaviceps BLCC-F50 TaxID=3153642 RepID=A0ABV4XT18_9CYAN